MIIEDQFHPTLNPIWQVTQIGTGTVTTSADEGLRLRTAPNSQGYSNAQITDYNYPPKHFRYRPPVHMTITARASGAGDTLRGTAGFGFWNHPFSPDLSALPRLPRSIWFFFASPPSDMRLMRGVPGSGWKAATIDATGAGALALIPAALPLTLLMRRPYFYDRLWQGIQDRLGVSEHLLAPELLAAWHTYEILWGKDQVVFRIDGVTVHETRHSPHGDAGFVAWIDNQYAVATPQGMLKFGIVPIAHEQSLLLRDLKIAMNA